MTTQAPNNVTRKYQIEFDARGSLSRAVTAPVAMNDPVGLVLFGDSSAIYIAHVTDSGASPYTPLSSIPVLLRSSSREAIAFLQSLIKPETKRYFDKVDI